ncbi:MAG: GtrA family protein [Janthinobacterium lividum]
MTDCANSGRPASTILEAGSAELRRFALYLGVGSTGLGVDAALFAAFHGAGSSPAAARAVSLAVATLVTFALNRRFTFVSSGRQARRDLARYVGVTFMAQGFSYGIFLGLLAMAPTLPSLIALVAGAAPVALISFAGQRLFTFRGD